MERNNNIEEEMYWEDYSMSENEEPQEDGGYVSINKEQAECFEEEERTAILKYKKTERKGKEATKEEKDQTSLKQAIGTSSKKRIMSIWKNKRTDYFWEKAIYGKI